MAFSKLISLPFVFDRALPEFQKGDDIRFPASLAEWFLKNYTQDGDKVLDPFCGTGTTFLACEAHGRVPYGVEADRLRYDEVLGQVSNKDHLKFGDSAGLVSFGFPQVDFSLTSPPYMPDTDAWNPLSEGDPAQGGYDRYLARMQEIYKSVCRIVKPGGMIVVQADNLTHEEFSPLVWDLGKALRAVMTLEGEIIVRWTGRPIEQDEVFTQCLVFRNNRNL